MGEELEKSYYFVVEELFDDVGCCFWSSCIYYFLYLLFWQFGQVDFQLILSILGKSH